MTIKYNIFKCFHYSLPPYPLFHCNIKEMKYKIKFDKNCWYSRDKVEYTGINKLCGLGFGLNHHKNSIRIGWQPDFENKDSILLYAYWYDSEKDGTYQSSLLGSVSTNQEFSAGIKLFNDNYDVYVNSTNLSIPNLYSDRKWGFYLRPYFGGKSRSPQSMEIKIKYEKVK